MKNTKELKRKQKSLIKQAATELGCRLASLAAFPRICPNFIMYEPEIPKEILCQTKDNIK